MSDGKVTKYDYPSSDTGGTRPLNLRGIFEDERRRLSEDFNDEERQYRKQWLKDQELSPNEPRPESEEWIREVRNPIRRALSKPWQSLETSMTPVTGKVGAGAFRYMVPKILVSIGLAYLGYYHLKYFQNDWTRAHGWMIAMPKRAIFPGEEGYPAKRERFEPSDYYDRGFKSRKVFLD